MVRGLSPSEILRIVIRGGGSTQVQRLTSCFLRVINLVMIQKLSVPVTVFSLFDHRRRTYTPTKVVFDGREFEIIKIGYHHTFRDGRTLLHVFSVASRSSFFKLIHNTDNLSWMLEEVDDGEVN